MNEHSQIEKLYTFLEESSEYLKPYAQNQALKALNLTLNYLLDDAVDMPLPDEVLGALRQLKDDITEETFDKVSMRKACQLMLLKAFKDDRYSNAMMTPDTMGILFGYLLDKLYPQGLNTIFDPMVGTANLLASLPQPLQRDIQFVGVDDDPLMIETATNLMDALQFNHDFYFQDTLTFDQGMYDALVCDFPITPVASNLPYLPYDVLLTHVTKLSPGGYALLLIENNFFEQRGRTLFQEALLKMAHLYGLIKLDEGMFKQHPKSVLILKRKLDEAEKIDDFLLADLPAFDDLEAFTTTLERIEQWFAKRKDD